MRFFFTLHEREWVVEPAEAHEARDVGEAIVNAIDASRDIMSSEVRSGRLSLSDYIVVRNEAGMEVGKILFRDALDLTGLGQGH